MAKKSPRKSTSGPANAIRDRIQELIRVPAKELIPNPKNWRTHPENQKAAIESTG